MPVERVIVGGVEGWRWGKHGKVYTGPGAQAKAEAQGRAARAAGYADRMVVGPGGALRLDRGRLPGINARRPRLPLHIERKYAALLTRRAKLTRDLLLARLTPLLKGAAGEELNRAAAARQDDALGDLLRALGFIQTVVEETIPIDQASILGIAQGVDAFATEQQAAIIQKVAAIDIFSSDPAVSLYPAFLADNVALIKSIDSRFFADVSEVVSEAARTGRTTAELAADIQERYSVSESRARLIARDQVSKFNAKVTQERQTRVGIQKFMWSTSGDERVRPSHRDMDGKVCEWAKPPEVDGETAIPGSPIACRCVAVAVFDDEDEKQLLAEQAAREASEAA